MDDSGYLSLRDQASGKSIIARRADDELCAFGYCPLESGRQVVEHHDALAAFDKGVDHMAAAVGRQDFARIGVSRHNHMESPTCQPQPSASRQDLGAVREDSMVGRRKLRELCATR